MGNTVGKVVESIRPILSKEQFRAIEAMFPTKYISPSASEAELRDYMGTQKVIEALRRRTS